MSSRVELSVNGDIYGGFIGGEVNLSMEQAANYFSLRYADRWFDDQEAVPIEAGDVCEVRIDGTTVITGYVDESTIQYSATSRELSVTGRSKTCDIVDCSAKHKSGQWKDQTVAQISSDLCKPFSITIKVDGKATRHERFALDTGETILEAIGRASRLNGLFPIAQPDGNLLLAKLGSKKTATKLQYGVNILEGARTENWQERFSDYLFRGQRHGNDQTNGESSAHLSSDVQDEQLVDRKRYRPLLVTSSGQDGVGQLKKRATWEKNRRAGKGERVQLTVVDFKNSEGLWQPNTLVAVNDKSLRIGDDKSDAILLVVSVRFRFGPTGEDGGYVTELELTRPEAFSQEPYPKRKRKAPLKSDNPLLAPEPSLVDRLGNIIQF